MTLFDMTQFTDRYASPEEMLAWSKTVMAQPPHFTIGDYMERWYILPRNDKCNLYLHRMLRDDDDVLHDHPWDNTSYVISGGYIEFGPHGEQHLRQPGDMIGRMAKDAHSLHLLNGRPSVSLFFTGPKIRDWGFHCPKGWVSWQDFTGGKHNGRSEKGAGCGELA